MPSCPVPVTRALRTPLLARCVSTSYYRNRPRPLPANTIVKFVPQQQAWIVERFGRFSRILEPGLAVLIPFVDQIKYVKTLKEVAIEVPTQSAITQGMALHGCSSLCRQRYHCHGRRPLLPCGRLVQGARDAAAPDPLRRATAWRIPTLPSRSLRRPPCAQRLAS